MWMIPLVISTKGFPEKKPFSSQYSTDGGISDFGVVSLEPLGRMPCFSLSPQSIEFEKLSTVILRGWR